MFRMVKCDRGNRVYRLAILLTVAAFAVQLISAERLPVKTYTVADGLLRDMGSRIRSDFSGFARRKASRDLTVMGSRIFVPMTVCQTAT